MKTVKDGTKFDPGDIRATGSCGCFCGTGSGYDVNFIGWDCGACACYCTAGAQSQYGCGIVIAP